MKKTKISNLASFLYEVGSLRKMPRAHMQTLLTSDLSDNIASHSYRVTMIGMQLAELEKADVNKVVKMCLLHDIAESRSGDQNWIHKKYVKVFEDEIAKDQMQSLPDEKGLLRIISEYNKRESLEAKIAKDADLIDQVLLLKEHEWGGNKEASSWLFDKKTGKKLFTKSARKLVKEIIKQDPSDWWRDIWTDQRR